jgi:hypothetical protein
LNCEETARVRDRRFNFLAVTDDACVLQQFFDGARREARDLRGVEIRERAPVTLAFAQDRPPAQAGLRCLEHEELEMHAIVAHRHAPLLVVIPHVGGIDAFAPSAAHDAFFCSHARVASITGWHGTRNRAESKRKESRGNDH